MFSVYTSILLRENYFLSRSIKMILTWKKFSKSPQEESASDGAKIQIKYVPNHLVFSIGVFISGNISQVLT